ncbi:MAG TPA: UDP-N-acetylglucosamine 1-carboxyvinyltransferase [Chloroflexota bacterium]|jgi:UDP-N-acetylglucosamine 1-carboxyvinyltransferase|nr:UDP-N-acetylglucosamine 1-carboxyvinyltransferase [Chloroflexota bacterium]
MTTVTPPPVPISAAAPVAPPRGAPDRRMVVTGGARLHGEIAAGGAKNAATKMMATCLLTREPVLLEHVPDIEAVHTQAALLRALGVRVEFDGANHRMTLSAERVEGTELVSELVAKERSAFVLVGPLLARLGEVTTAMPGGCKIGERPVNVGVRGLEALGVESQLVDGTYSFRTSGLRGARIYLDYPSHTGTENLIMAACLANGTTVVKNAACEPEVVALAEHLNRMGAIVRGAGTPRIEIIGVPALHGARTRVMPDRIEAGSFAIAAAATGGDVVIRNVVPEHLDAVVHKLRDAGAEVFESDDAIRVWRNRPLRAVEVQAIHYPGFPTDLQTPFCAMLTQACGDSVIQERVFDDRFNYVQELRKLGARIETNGDPGSGTGATRAYVHGPTPLTGAAVRALDLRSGIALTIAGLVAAGSTEIADFHHAERGYEDLTSRFRALGAELAPRV